MNKFEQVLDSGRPLILDGGLATQLEAMGFDIGTSLWSAGVLSSNPRAIVDAHLAYLEAGAQCIISASYQASRPGFMAHGMSADEADRMIVRAVELAKQAREEFLAASGPPDAEPLVAASIGPYATALHDGSEYTGYDGVTDTELHEFQAPRLELLDACEADVLAVETIPDATEARVMCELLKSASTPAWVTFCCRDERSLSDGSALRAAAELYADHPKVLAVGINCTAPQYVSSLIGEVRQAAPRKHIVVYPNSGEIYHSATNSWSGTACDLDADFAVDDWFAAGARLIGGCCRTGPADIAAIRARLLDRQD